MNRIAAGLVAVGLLASACGDSVVAANGTATTIPRPVLTPDPGGRGPAAEACETDGVVVDDLRDVADAEPGSVVLLRGGVYERTLRIPAGSSGDPTVVKPYGCEIVEVRASVFVDSWTTVAGLFIESSDTYVVEAIRKSSDPMTNVVVRNNVIRGGRVEAIRIAQNVHQVQIVGNDLDGGEKRHVLKVHWEGSQWRPSDISIVDNLFHKDETGSGTDLIQLEGHQTVHIEGNTFENGATENAVDVKSAGPGGGVTIVDNYFDGSTFPSACLLVHGDFALNYVTNNYFDNGCGVALGAHPEDSLSPWWRFEGNTIIDGELKIRRSFDAEFIGNTMEGGTIKLGLGGGDYPRDAVIEGNTFNGVEMIDRVTAAGGSYTCTGNDLAGATGDWDNC